MFIYKRKWNPLPETSNMHLFDIMGTNFHGTCSYQEKLLFAAIIKKRIKRDTDIACHALDATVCVQNVSLSWWEEVSDVLVEHI